MRYRSKPRIVEAFRFDGTFTGPAGVQAADDWVKANEIENCEVTCQGKKEPLALDVTTERGLCTIEAGDWLFVDGELVCASNDTTFNEAFEACQ